MSNSSPKKNITCVSQCVLYTYKCNTGMCFTEKCSCSNPSHYIYPQNYIQDLEPKRIPNGKYSSSYKAPKYYKFDKPKPYMPNILVRMER